MKDLLLITLEGLAYGIWEDEVQAIEDLQSLHRLPLSPACIAGMSIINDRTVALADLSVCVGHRPMRKNGSEHVLIMSDHDKVTGFVIQGEITRVPVPPDGIHPMPDYLKTPVIDSCALHDSLLIPIINIRQLFTRVQHTDSESAVAPISVTASAGDIFDIARFRLVEIDGEPFAVPAGGVEDGTVEPGRIFPLRVTPSFVRGITRYRETILPVIDLTQRIRFHKSKKEGLLLVAEVKGMRFGLLVDQDRGPIAAPDFTVKQLPPIAGSPLMSAALMHDGEVVPVLDPGVLLSTGTGNAQELALPLRYSPDSAFPARFGKDDVEITEFSLLGARHALPRSEVEDVIEFRPYRPVPNTVPIVIGVSEYKGELLPVLDLAMAFGRRSLVTPEWRMMAVRNGDFRALVIAETVFGDRRLVREVQRSMPIVLPHRVVYGCYPDTDAIRLILNVQSLAVHFQNLPVQEFLPALSKEMKQAAAEIVPSMAPFEDPDERTKAETSVRIREEGKIEEDNGNGEVVAGIEERKQAIPTAEEVGPGGSMTLGSQTAPYCAPETKPEPALESTPLAGTENVPDEHEAPASSKEEKPVSEGEGEDAAPDQHFEVPHERSAPNKRIEQDIEEQEQPVVEAETGQAAMEEEVVDTVPGSSFDKAKQEEPRPDPTPEELNTAESLPVHQAARVMNELKQAQESATMPLPGISMHQPVPSASDEAKNSPLSTGSSGGALDNKRKRSILFAAVTVAALMILHFSWFYGRTTVDKKGAKSATANPPVQMPHPQMTPRRTLVLEVPADRTVDIGVYVVRDGDTLWDISERFTGNPTSYPRIAGENRIANPDLIFPGQRIYLNKKR